MPKREHDELLFTLIKAWFQNDSDKLSPNSFSQSPLILTILVAAELQIINSAAELIIWYILDIKPLSFGGESKIVSYNDSWGK